MGHLDPKPFAQFFWAVFFIGTATGLLLATIVTALILLVIG